MKKELLLIQGTRKDPGLQSKAAYLAQKGNLRLRMISVAGLEESTPDDAVIAERLVPLAENARVILAPATVRLRSIMPMLAWHLQAGLTADCTQLDISEVGELIQTRPAFGNSLMATIRSVSETQMATVRPGTFPAGGESVLPEEELTESGSGKIMPVAFTLFEQAAPIAQASIIVAGGGGIGSKEGFRKLTAFAKKIGAAVGASRNAVDAGYAPYACQVGLTGVTVSPKLYIAVGISGAVQHLAGFSGAETVIAINADPDAPIFQYADHGIVGDWEQIIDQFMEESV